MPLLAVRLTRSPIALGAVTAAATLPWLVVALPAGALADRLDRRRTMLQVQVLRVVVAVTLAVAVATDVASVWLLAVVALVLGVGETFFDTASQSIMPMVVPREELSSANGRLFGAQLVTNQLAGPPIGGLLAGIALTWPFVGSAGLYALAVVYLAAMKGSFRPAARPPARLRTDIAEGLRYVWGTPVLRTFGMMLGTMNMAGVAAMSQLPLFAVGPGPMGLTEAGFGLLMTGGAIGGAAASVSAARMERWLGRGVLIRVCVAVGAVAVAAPAFSTSPWVVGGLSVIGGASSVVWNVITVSLRQAITPDHLLGRMNATYRLLGWGTMPIGALLGGVVAETFGLRTTFAAAGVVTASLLVFTVRAVSEQAIAAAESAADARDAATVTGEHEDPAG